MTDTPTSISLSPKERELISLRVNRISSFVTELERQKQEFNDLVAVAREARGLSDDWVIALDTYAFIKTVKTASVDGSKVG